jgi:acyl-CoA hydrolase
MAGKLPGNVRVREFYLYAGKLLSQSSAQREYISTNYTHVARDLLERGVNVLCQAVSHGVVDGKPMFSLSCNADVSPDVLRGLANVDYPYVVVAQVNGQLPFMYGDALVPEETFDFVVDDQSQYHRPFPTPKTSVSDPEYLIGLYASTLVRDGGSLQIGIGAIGDALTYALLLRHTRNAEYLRVLDALSIRQRFSDVIARVGGTAPFERGLFAPTEMLVDGFMHLIEAGIVKREVYDDLAIEQLLADGRIEHRVSLATLDALLDARAVPVQLDADALAYLQRFGVLRAELRLDASGLRLPDGAHVAPDLRDPETRRQLTAQGLGEHLRDGKVVHAGFFVGPERFYDWLRALPEAERRRIDMRTVTRVNQLYGHEPLARLQRRHARFVNTGMMATLLGAVVSDGLDSGRVVSGVGGQYNFVTMAHALPEARSILQVRATRPTRGELVSNIVYEYGHTTIPRHLRDLLVTEYGIADLRGRTDEEVIAATLAVTDAAAQPALIERAQHEGKLSSSYAVPELHAGNHAERYAKVFAELRRQGLFPAFPFGTELTEQEVELSRALRALKERMSSVPGELAALTAAAAHGGTGPDVQPLLERMGLADPEGATQTLYARLLASELRRQRDALT